MRKSPRQRRLEADFRSVAELDAESSIFSFEATGEPPTRYRLRFDGPGICRDGNGRIAIVEKHEVIVELGASYPRMVPNLLWQTPIFHPNISNNGVVCLGGYGTHWVPSLTLDEMSTMLWDMIRYKNFDIQSPYNREAALWARDQRVHSFPLDDRDIRDLVNKPKETKRPVQASVEVVESQTKNGKSVFGVLGALANRFRDRTDRPDRTQPTDQGEDNLGVQEVHTAEDVSVVDAIAVVEVPPEIVVEQHHHETTEGDFVDPSEIEIIEDGISFIDPEDNQSNKKAKAANEVAEDTGIVFLD